jgi:flagellar basal body-associated protein FliL
MSFLFRLVCLLLLLVMPSGVARAAEHGGGHEAKAEGGGHGGGEAKVEESGGNPINDIASIFNAGEGEPVYVRMKPVVLPVISDKGAEQLVNLVVDLETKDYDTAVDLNNNKPKLNDAIIRSLYGGLSDGSMRNANALDIIKIKTNIKDTINQTFGEGTVLNVFVQAVEQRKF